MSEERIADQNEEEYRVIVHQNEGALKIDVIQTPKDVLEDTELDTLVIPAFLGIKLASAVVTELTGKDPWPEDPD